MMFVCVFTTLSLSLSLVDFDRFRIVFLSTPKNMCIFTLTWMLLLRTLFLTSGQFNSLFISSSLADRQRVHHKKKEKENAHSSYIPIHILQRTIFGSFQILLLFLGILSSFFHFFFKISSVYIFRIRFIMINNRIEWNFFFQKKCL